MRLHEKNKNLTVIQLRWMEAPYISQLVLGSFYGFMNDLLTLHLTSFDSLCLFV